MEKDIMCKVENFVQKVPVGRYIQTGIIDVNVHDIEEDCIELNISKEEYFKVNEGYYEGKDLSDEDKEQVMRVYNYIYKKYKDEKGLPIGLGIGYEKYEEQKREYDEKLVRDIKEERDNTKPQGIYKKFLQLGEGSLLSKIEGEENLGSYAIEEVIKSVIKVKRKRKLENIVEKMEVPKVKDFIGMYLMEEMEYLYEDSPREYKEGDESKYEYSGVYEEGSLPLYLQGLGGTKYFEVDSKYKYGEKAFISTIRRYLSEGHKKELHDKYGYTYREMYSSISSKGIEEKVKYLNDIMCVYGYDKSIRVKMVNKEDNLYQVEISQDKEGVKNYEGAVIFKDEVLSYEDKGDKRVITRRLKGEYTGGYNVGDKISVEDSYAKKFK